MVSPIIQTMTTGANSATNSFRTSEEALQGALSASNSIVNTSNSLVNISNQKVSLDMKMYQLLLNSESQKFNELMGIKKYQLDQYTKIKQLQLQKLQLQQNSLFQNKQLELNNQFRTAQLESNNQFRTMQLKDLEKNNERTYQLRLQEDKDTNKFREDSLNLKKIEISNKENNIDISKVPDSYIKINGKTIALDSTNPKDVTKTVQLLKGVGDNKGITNILYKYVSSNNFNYDVMSSNKDGKKVLAQLGFTPTIQKANIFRLFADSKGIDLNKININDINSISRTYVALDKNNKQISNYFLSYVKTVLNKELNSNKISQSTFNNLNGAINNMINFQKTSNLLINNPTKETIKKASNISVNKPDMQNSFLSTLVTKCGNSLNCNNLITFANESISKTGLSTNMTDIGSSVKKIALGSNNNVISRKLSDFSNFISRYLGMNMNVVNNKTNTDNLKSLSTSAYATATTKAVYKVYNSKIKPLLSAYKISPTDIMVHINPTYKHYQDKFFFKNNQIGVKIGDIADNLETLRVPNDTYSSYENRNNKNRSTVINSLALDSIKYNLFKKKNPNVDFYTYLEANDKNIVNYLLSSYSGTVYKSNVKKDINKLGESINDEDSRKLLLDIGSISSINVAYSDIVNTQNK